MATTFQVAKNRAKSALAADITSAATSLTVTAGEGAKFPSTYPFPITIEDEILKCTNRSTDTLTVERAQEGTTAAAHATGKAVHLRITAKFASDLHTAVNAIENKAAFGRLDGWTADQILKGAGASANPTEEHMNQSCKVTNSVAQSIPDATATALTWDTETWDTNTIHDTTTNPSRLTCKVAGIYLVVAFLGWASNTTGRRTLRLYKNGTQISVVEMPITATAPYGNTILVDIVSLAVDDYIESMAHQTSGAALNTAPAACSFAMHRLVS